MELPTNFQQLIERWPSKRQFGREVCGTPARGGVMHRRNSIPRRLHQTVVDLAPAHGLQGVTLEYLAGLWDQADRGR